MEDNKPLMSFAPTMHWILSFCIVQYSMEFVLHSVVLDEHAVVLELLMAKYSVDFHVTAA